MADVYERAVLAPEREVGSPASVLDEVAVYDHTLSATQVARHYAASGRTIMTRGMLRARFQGTESVDALLSNGQAAHRLFGYPRVGVGQMLEWIAAWVRRGGANLGKPTHFEVRDGNF